MGRSIVRARRSGARARAAALTLVAAAALGGAPAQAQLPAIATEAPLDTRQGVNFHALVRPDTVYVGQQANYQVGVFLNEDVRTRLRRNPEFVPPEMTGLLSYELPIAHGVLPRSRGGQYEVHVFERAVFPLTAGVHQIPPARLSYSLPLTRSFFSREESYTLRSGETSVVALAPPAAGRPDDYGGAVAAGIVLSSRVDSVAARVGDPLLLTVRVGGRGNVNLFPRPQLSLSWGDAVPGDERVRLDTTARAIGGVKEFDWLVTPRRDGRVVIPVLRYPYFDPYRERYEVAVTRPDTLVVGAGTIVALDTAAPRIAPLPNRRVLDGPAPTAPSRSPLYWLAAAVLPLPFALLRVRRRGPRQARLPSAAEALGALAPADVAGPAGAARLRALFLRALTTRLGHPALVHARSDGLARTLRREGVSSAPAAEVEALLDALDRLAYDARPGVPARDDAAALGAQAARLFGVIDAEARRRGAGTSARVPMLVGLLAAGLLLGAPIAARAVQAVVRPPSAAELFADGVRAYEVRRFGDAQSLFAAVTRRVPRAPDAWANLGTAAWASGDSAAAALGWQRALRLEPTARDLRDRLARLPGAQLDGFALVPPVSPVVLEWCALGGWALLWLVAAVLLLRRPRGHGLRPAGLGTGSAAVLALYVSAVMLDERLAARDLAVVADAVPARTLPAVVAPASVALHAGEVVYVRERRGVWARVRTAGATGWVEAARLTSLARD